MRSAAPGKSVAPNAHQGRGGPGIPSSYSTQSQAMHNDPNIIRPFLLYIFCVCYWIYAGNAYGVVCLVFSCYAREDNSVSIFS